MNMYEQNDQYDQLQEVDEQDDAGQQDGGLNKYVTKVPQADEG